MALIGTWGSVQWLPLWADQMTGGRVPSAKALAQILVSAGAMAGSLLGALAAGRIGRRPAYFGLCLLSLLLCGWLFRSVDHYGAAFLVIVTLVGAATAAFYGWLPLYLPELFPTRVRATGQGLCYNSGRILAAVGALTQGQLVAAYAGSYARAGATDYAHLPPGVGADLAGARDQRPAAARVVLRPRPIRWPPLVARPRCGPLFFLYLSSIVPLFFLYFSPLFPSLTGYELSRWSA